MKRFFCFMITLVIIIVLLSGCKGFRKNSPSGQPSTKWISEDGQMFFIVDENGDAFGEMLIDNETIDIYVGMGMDTTDIDITHLESKIGNSVTEISFEHWIGDFDFNDHFTATVKRTTYFHVGDKITFYRVDDDATLP